jgi:hypothetical protein
MTTTTATNGAATAARRDSRLDDHVARANPRMPMLDELAGLFAAVA